MVIEPYGYCGMVLLEDGRIDIAAAVDAAAVSQTSPADLLRTMLAKTGLGPLPLLTARIRGTPPLTHRRRRTQGRVFRVGDAACYVNQELIGGHDNIRIFEPQKSVHSSAVNIKYSILKALCSRNRLKHRN